MECHSKLNVTQNGMSLKQNVPQYGMSLKVECCTTSSFTQNGISIKMKCHSKWIFTQHGMSHKTECHSKWNVTQNGISLITECHSKWKIHWRTLVPFVLELYLSSTGAPLENWRTTGAPGDAPGHDQAVPLTVACPGHQTLQQTLHSLNPPKCCNVQTKTANLDLCSTSLFR